MKPIVKIFLAAFILIVLLDAIGSIASRRLNFNYTIFAPLSFVIYSVFGFLSVKKIKLKSGVWVGVIIGFFDSTIGWKISTLLNANTGRANNEVTPVVWIINMICVIGVAAVCGLIGGLIAKKMKTQQKSS